MVRIPPDEALNARLARWVAEGLLDAGQAERIEAAERTRAAEGADQAGAAQTRTGRAGAAQTLTGEADGAQTPAAGTHPAGRVPLVVEALGYLGAAMAVVAGFLAADRLWPDIPTGAQLALAAVAAVVLGVAGALLRDAAEPAFVRLRGVLWLASTGSVAAFAGVLAVRVGDFSPQVTALTTAGAATAYGIVPWLVRPAPLQQLAVFAGTAVTLAAGIECLGDDVPLWVPGVGVWLLSALWGAAAHRGHVRPRETGYVAAALGLLVGAQLTMNLAAGHLLALATAGALLALGVALRRVWALLLGAFATLQTVPQTAERYLPGSLAAPLSILVVGAVLLVLALLLARWSSRTAGTPRPPRSPRAVR
ncbi:hypothetical protein ACH4ZX_26310 [Streptomyces sp. NPDC020490]|uniref:hypothetical protein n=1 Tax=Streptomyces sp. NPDC020490 TaxID=3365078 RepID=UPI0037A51200